MYFSYYTRILVLWVHTNASCVCPCVCLKMYTNTFASEVQQSAVGVLGVVHYEMGCVVCSVVDESAEQHFVGNDSQGSWVHLHKCSWRMR